ncbi:uncharacterized protein LOC105795943 [Gossypium raimondii]|uniref:uncharacterized protein LOC105795943 n=1 Tax=Gossypium raimondii TaxID=29730 RepID=UPI00063AB368|nr:uncharacterized protein LOC105795943 [Gossypium raimondii]
MGKEHCKAITLRSGKQTGEPTTDSTVAPQDTSEVIPSEKVEFEELVEVSAQSDVPPPLPFPQRFRENEQDKQYQQFLNKLKQLQVNIILVDALVKILNYEKFMKELLSKKKKLSDIETILLTKGCSVVLTNKLPPKMKDPGSFTIPCSIENHYLGKTLCDLGASINLMPLSTFPNDIATSRSILGST